MVGSAWAGRGVAGWGFGAVLGHLGALLVMAWLVRDVPALAVAWGALGVVPAWILGLKGLDVVRARMRWTRPVRGRREPEGQADHPASGLPHRPGAGAVSAVAREAAGAAEAERSRTEQSKGPARMF